VETQVHGALVEVLGVGVLIRGPSGIGKSETALELVARGHRLVADDVVRIQRLEDGSPAGSAPEIIRHHIEIRGIGILYIPDLYGADAVRESARIGVVCRLEHWREGEEYDRVGFSRETELVAGVAVPVILLPVRPSGNMATLIEVAIRDHLHRCAGAGSAASRLDERLRVLVERA
jgi:HPr kinase/phosphorylase